MQYPQSNSHDSLLFPFFVYSQKTFPKNECGRDGLEWACRSL